MYYLLKNLTATQQIGALFIIVFGLLLIASATVFLLSVKTTATMSAQSAFARN